MKIFARSPTRLGLGGGGTDLKVYSQEFGGEVLNVTIGQYVQCITTIIDQYDVCISYDKGITENKTTSSKTLSLHWATIEYFRQKYDVGVGFVRIATHTDIPVGSGLGTSSSLVVTMVKALSELFQIKLGKAQIVEDSAHIERNICGFEGGMQDYISAVYGGLNNTKFYRDGSYFVQPIRLSQDDIAIFEQSCFLVSSGASRFSGEIIRHQSQSLSSKVRLNAMHDVKKSAGNITRHLINSDYEKFFHEMALSWEAKKRTSSKIVNPEIRRLEKLVMDNGGSAIKVSGAGGGGFIQVFAKPEESLYLRALLERSWEIRNVSLIETGTRAWMAE